MNLFVALLVVLTLTGNAVAEQKAVPPPKPYSRTLLVFMSGQSNMDGNLIQTPESYTYAAHRKGLYIYAKSNLWFAPAFDPSGSTEETYGGSAYPAVWPAGVSRGPTPALAFGDRFLTLTTAPIRLGLIPIGKGGTTISQHLPGTPLFAAGANRVHGASRNGRRGKVIGGVFSQGESDAMAKNCKTADQWAGHFNTLVAAWRRRFGSDLPIVFAQLGDAPVDDPDFPADCWATVKAQQAEAAASIPNVAMIATNGLAKNADQIHYTSDSQRIIGQRMANELYRLTRRN